MGRIEKSQGLAPPAKRKDVRAKQARHIVNRVVPAILASNARARRGAEGSELIPDPGPVAESDVTSKENAEAQDDVQYVKRKGQGRRKVKGGDEVIVREGHEKKGKGKRRNDSRDETLPSFSVSATLSNVPSSERKANRKTRVITTDTLTAAHMLTEQSNSDLQTSKAFKKKSNVCILNMASPLRPGGGVLTGATSQEEFLCARTTLLPSLKESFYRLPEVGGIYTHDVLVFRNASSLGSTGGQLAFGERYWIDVISAGMLRFPELEEEEEEEVKRLGKKDREMVERKMRAVLRIACSKGITKLVLGAWGCGAYGNPVADIAKAWRRVLDGANTSQKGGKRADESETWDQLEDVVFAVTSEKIAQEFGVEYGGGIEVERRLGGDMYEEGDDKEEDTVAEELGSKIQEMENQIAQVWNPDLKARMGVILDSLKTQLNERQSNIGEANEPGKKGGDCDSEEQFEGDEEDNDYECSGQENYEEFDSE